MESLQKSAAVTSSVHSEDDTGYDSDFDDLGFVDIWSDESETITEILTLKNTTRDKIAYTIFSVNIFFTCFLVGYCPHYFYMWHTVKFIILISYRWYTYKKTKNHYFLFDFCYFTNFLILLYCWFPEYPIGAHYRGLLFIACYSFANGPLLGAIVLWRNSLVPHSNDKMTSLFIHVSPALSTWGIRWHSTEEQGFPLCSSLLGAADCSDVRLMDVLFYPMVIYFFWQMFYILYVEIIAKKKVEQKQYNTSYKYIAQQSKNSVISKLIGIFGAQYRKPMYILVQLLFTIITIQLGYVCYLYKEVNMLAVSCAMSVASYNGASFYIDVFSHKYSKSKAP